MLEFDQERDITTDPEWERLYQYEIPVLAKVLPDGTEVSIDLLAVSLLPSVNVFFASRMQCKVCIL